MSHKFLVGYDGSAASRRALDFAVDRAQHQGGSVIVAHVLEWSPYSFLTPQEIEERHVRRTEELKRAETALMNPVVEALSAKGIEVDTAIKYGHIADTICDIAKEKGANQMFIGRNGHGGIASRVFGSVAGSLVQTAPVPCTIVP